MADDSRAPMGRWLGDDLNIVGCSVCDWTGGMRDHHSAYECARRQVKAATDPLHKRLAQLERNVAEMARGGRG